MARMTKHLIVLSLDALGSVDFDLLASMPHTKKLLKRASFCKQVMPIYPSLTYPSHTSIITGCYPNKHGIINNTLLQPKRKSPDWNWYASQIKVPSVIDLALANGMKVAALMWPVTAKSKIQYNLPEIFANRGWHNQVSVSLLNGSPYYTIKMNRLFGSLRNGRKQPALDNFVHAVAMYTVKTYRPDLTLVHFTDLDTKKHHYGSKSSEREEAIALLDQRIGDFVNLIEVEGLTEEVTLVLLGDHSQMDAHTIIYLNDLFLGENWLTVRDGRIADYKVIAKTCDGSTYVYLKNPADKKLLRQVERFLHDVVEDSDNGISLILNGEEAAILGADPACAFMLEAIPGFYFLDEVGHGFLQAIDYQGDHQYSHALIGVHGYLPTLPNYQTVLIATGAGIKAGVEITDIGLIDEGPTFAYLLGLHMKNVDGRVVTELLADKN